ncbi:MAG TPA: HAMP domain-containing sensor histidine kinase [Spirochaetia bacterium]|nr:HAMP domain-containing sensor histidine kinase [Spirochaetia bacterium]
MRSITWRLTIWYAGILVVILTISGLAAFWGMRYILFNNAAQEAHRAVSTVQNMAAPDEDNDTGGFSHLDLDDPALVNAAGNSILWLQVTSPAGTVLTSSLNLKNRPLDPGYSGPPKLLSLDGRDVYLAGGRLPGGATVQVARPLAGEEDFLKELARVFVFLVLGGLLLALAGGWVITRAAMSPVQRLTLTAQKIGTSDLRRRLSLRGARDELYVLGETFNQMLDRLEKGFRSQQEFVAAASHDLRTPLTVIKSYADLLSRWGKNEPAVVDESVQAINRAAGLMERLVNDLLLLTQVDAGMPFQPVTLDLTEMAVETLQMARAMAGDITVEMPSVPPVAVDADDHYLRRALWALVDNALKYNRPGGKVVLLVGVDQGQAFFSVTDTGPGIAEESISRIFERFYRADDARTQGKGFGLGLALAKSIVEAHGGRITVQSRPGEGSCFTILLPVSGARQGSS